MNTLARRVARVAVPVLVAASGLAACGSPDTTNSSSGSTQSGSAPTYRSPSSNAATPLAAQPPVAITHIHAIARDPKNGELLLATHEGLFLRSGTDLRQAGPVIDLMAFAIAPDGTFYASGHPGAEVDLPQPVGLIVSTDSGRTWQIASLGGQSDFHALAAGPSMVAGFDGDLRVTRDGKTWITRSIPAPPRTLAAAPKSGTLIATTQAGLRRRLWHMPASPRKLRPATHHGEHFSVKAVDFSAQTLQFVAHAKPNPRMTRASDTSSISCPARHQAARRSVRPARHFR